MKPCALCERPAWARTRYCGTHYYRQRRAEKRGHVARSTRDLSAAERLEFYSERITETGCQIWTGCANRSGYGRFGIGDRVFLAHRVAWELAHGPIKRPDVLVCHRCDVPACINVAHLFLGTDQDNKTDAARKGRMARGERRPEAKLRRSEVLEIRDELAPQREVAARYGICQQNVSQIKRRTRWAWL